MSAATHDIPATHRARSRRAYWVQTLHRWHWISAAVSLAGMLLFAVTGITLNHAEQIAAEPQVTAREAQLPAGLRDTLRVDADTTLAPLPAEVQQWLGAELGIGGIGGDAEWSDGEVYLALPRPGGDAWLAIDTGTGAVSYERTDRGWIAYANDLHKGRNTGTAWRWLIDLLALACVVFCATGLFLLQVHAGQRTSTWPLVGLGVLLPLLLVLLLVH